MSTILERIQQIADNENIKITAFEKTIGASKGVLSRAINNGTDIQAKWIQLIVENYPRYSECWLLTGKGPMIKKDIDDNMINIEEKYEGIPLIPISAMAGALVGEQSIIDEECERFNVPSFKGADFMIPVKGDSMTPTYQSGDIVACKRVPMSDLFFQWNKVYVIDTNQGALIKRIKRGSTPDRVMIFSDNTSYDPFELPISDIYAVALVIGMIRSE